MKRERAMFSLFNTLSQGFLHVELASCFYCLQTAGRLQEEGAVFFADFTCVMFGSSSKIVIPPG